MDQILCCGEHLSFWFLLAAVLILLLKRKEEKRKPVKMPAEEPIDFGKMLDSAVSKARLEELEKISVYINAMMLAQAQVKRAKALFTDLHIRGLINSQMLAKCQYEIEIESVFAKEQQCQNQK